MKRFVDWRIFLPTVALAALVAWAVHHWIAFPFWGSLAIVIAAILVNGLDALVADEMPGGFNNRREKAGLRCTEIAV